VAVGRVAASLPAGGGSRLSLTAERTVRAGTATCPSTTAGATITLGERRFRVESDGFAEIAAAVREDMLPALLQTPFRTDLGPPPTGRRAGRDSIGGKSFYRNATRYSEGQQAVIGLAAEVVALEWLKAQLQYADIVVTWRSGYQDKVEGCVEGNDGQQMTRTGSQSHRGGQECEHAPKVSRVARSSGYGSGTVIFAVNCPGSRLWKTRGSIWLIRSTVLGVAIALASGKRFLIYDDGQAAPRRPYSPHPQRGDRWVARPGGQA
jgi:hypothetical protein